MPIHRQRKFNTPEIAVGEVLWAVRTSAGIDLRQGAENAAIDHRVLSRIERGERPCRVTEFIALAQAYGRSPQWLLSAVTGDRRARASLDLAPLN